MQLDRSRFLLLTSTMAAGACAADPPPARAPVVVAAPPSAAQGIGVADIPSVYRQHPTDDPMAEPAGTPGGASGLDAADVGVKTAQGPSPLAARCQTLRPPPGPYCEDFEWTRALCESFDQTMIPRVAEAAVDCVMTHDRRKTLCTPIALEQCFVKALNRAPASHVDQGECSAIMGRCGRIAGGPPSVKTCRRAAAAMKPAYRDTMLTCISEGCTIADCVYATEP